MPTLNWIGKDAVVNHHREVPYHLLRCDEKLSVGDVGSGNLLVQGDNLLALKALLPYYAGQVKCIYIDPPYNTGSAFAHYDDGVEHATWLSFMYPRLVLLHELLMESGSIWINIDDAEGHYLKVICDGIFGRHNFLGTVTWQKTTSVHNNAIFFSSATDMILAYAKDITRFTMGRPPRSERNVNDYSNPDDDPRGPWASSPLHVSLTSGQRGKQYAETGKSSGLFPLVSQHGEEVLPPKGRCWGYSLETIKKLEQDGRIWWGKDGRNQPRLKRYLRENKEGVVPTTLWLSEDVGHNQEAKAENASLLPDVEELFATPKPERLIKRILECSTAEGDLVVDSFAGSGTTGAVAHKMKRQWVLVEMGDHCTTHVLPRLRKVVAGEDKGGVSKVVGWVGGGGFRFCQLSHPVFDENGQIHAEVRFADLAAHVFFTETGEPIPKRPNGRQPSPLIGVCNGTAYYLLFNGVLGDKRPDGGNVLTSRILDELPPHDGPKVIYGEGCRLGAARLKREGTTFKQVPYEIKVT